MPPNDLPFIARYMKTLSYLRWRDPELINVFVGSWLDLLSKHLIHSLSDRNMPVEDKSLLVGEFCRILSSCANLNFFTEKFQDYIKVNGEVLFEGIREVINHQSKEEIQELLLAVMLASNHFELPKSLLETVLSIKWQEQSPGMCDIYFYNKECILKTKV